MFDKVRCLRSEVAEKLVTLLLVAADATELQLCQDLDQHISKGGHHKDRIEVAKATNGGKCCFLYIKGLVEHIVTAEGSG